MSGRRTSAFLLASSLTAISAEGQRTIRVPRDAPTIQAGIDAAVDGDTVLLSDGTYAGTGNVNVDFRGKRITVRSQHGPSACIVDCRSGGRGFLFQSGETRGSVVEGLTITGGSADDGGAVYCTQSRPRLVNCVLRNNSAEYGGAIYCREGSVTVRACTIDHNTASRRGGGIYASGGRLRVVKGAVASNVAGGDGGGIYASRCLTRISNTSVSYNFSNSGGGGISTTRRKLRINEGTLMGNSSRGHGGAVSANKTECTIENSSIISSYVTSANGGGLLFYRRAIALTNCLILSNYANHGGGAMFDSCRPTLSNCTFAGNSYFYGGGAMTTYRSDARIRDSILWANGDEPMELFESSPVITYSDFQNFFWPGEGNISKDPLFAVGKLGRHYLSESEAGEPHTSPCVDAGSDTAERLGLDRRTTRTDGIRDVGRVDMGYHFPRPGFGRYCEQIKRLTLRCSRPNEVNRLRADVRSSLRMGAIVAFRLDGEELVKTAVDGNGRSRAVWRNVSDGEHEVCVDDCPGLCAMATCGP